MVAIATQPSLRWRRPRKRSNMGGCIIIIVVLLLVFLAIAAFSVLMFEFSDTPMQMTPGHHSVIPSRLPRNGKGMSSPKGKYNRTTAPPQTHRISLCNTTDAIDRQACLLANRRAKPVPKKRPVVVRRPLPLDAVILCNNLPKDSPSVVEQEAIRNRLSTSMDRFRRVSPNRTLLELLAEARGPGVKTNIEALAAAPPVQVRFLTVTTGVDAYTVSSVAGAAVSGVRLEILGVGWKDFSFPGRFALLLSYIEKEGLKDSDVVMLMDNDAMFVGLDPYLAIQSFVTLSPAAREDLAGCARDIRLGWRMAPIRFTAENYCMRRQVAPVGKCTPDYDIMARMVGSWRPMSESAFEKEDLSVNATNRYLNTGVMVARVWALRTYVPILHMYTRTHTPISDGPAWTSDQSITATLYLHLRWWEVMSGVLNGTQPRPLTTAQLAASELRGRPDFAPTDDLAPYGLPAGLMDIDVYNRLASILAITTETRGSLTYGPVRIYKSHRAAFRGIDRAQKELYCNTSLCIGKSPIDTTISKVSLRLVRRSGVECAEEMMHTARCRFVAASLGQTTATSVTPLVWHYAGNEKMQTARDYSKWLPWRAAGRVSASFLADTLHVIHQGLTVQMWNAHGKLGKVGEYPTIGDQNVSGYALDFPNFCRRAK